MKKKTKVILLILILILLILILRETYSKYVNQAIAVVSEKIGQWVIKVNNLDITDEENIDEKFLKLSDFNWENSSGVADGKIAPGTKGYFDLVIDPSDTEVSFEYTITIDLSEFSDIVVDEENDVKSDIDFDVISVTEQNGKTLEITRDDTNKTVTVKRIKLLSEIQNSDNKTKIDTVRIKLEWKNNEDNDEIDTKLGSQKDTKITLPVTFRALQYVGKS